jgi:hypothetical protein
MNVKKQFLVLFSVLYSTFMSAQIGLGIVAPDPSAIVDLKSDTKGFLTPRMTIEERDLIKVPATGLLIFNTTTAGFNYFDTKWRDFSKIQNSVKASGAVSTTSALNVKIPEMSLKPEPGTYLAMFNSQYTNSVTITTKVNTDQSLADLDAIYNQINDVPTTNDTHPFLFGSLAGEVLSPGKYSVQSAIAIGENLILDGGGNQNAVFIFQALGDITLASFTTITLSNGTKAENVFWLAEGAVNVGEGATMKGTLFSHGFAVSLGALCVLEGRMYTTAGAIAFGPGAASLPANFPDTIDLKSLSHFLIFTGSGAINNTGTTTVYNGDIATQAGDTGSLAAAIVNGIIYPSGISTSVVFSGVSYLISFVSFSLYKNGVEIPGSSRRVTCDSELGNVLLQSLVTIEKGDVIDVRWKTEGGVLGLSNRSLILIKAKS